MSIVLVCCSVELGKTLQAAFGEIFYPLIGEVKNRIKKFSIKEAKEFHAKVQALAEREDLKKPLGFVFSVPGFTPATLKFFKKKGIAWSKDQRWIDY